MACISSMLPPHALNVFLNTAPSRPFCDRCALMDELPTIVLDKIFSCCDTVTLATISSVCKHWQEVFSNSVVALPALKLCGPLHDTWLSHNAKRVVRVTLKRVEELDRVTWMSNLKVLM